jgi:hypothetical protein
MSNQNETCRFPTFGAALDRIEACDIPVDIRSAILDAVCEAHDGAPVDMIESRTRLNLWHRVIGSARHAQIGKLIDGIDLDAIRDESARVGCNYRDEQIGGAA